MKFFRRFRRPKSSHSDADLWIVVSHDCDVTNGDLEVEPYVELLPLKLAQDKVGHFHWGKNPRRYQLIDGAASEPRLLDAEIHDLVRIPRSYLLDEKPDEHRMLEKRNVQLIVRWIAQRYVRAAFPDAFNNRTQPAVARLRKGFKRDGHLLTGIYLTINDDELNAGEDYTIDVCATMRVEDYADSKLRQAAQVLVNNVEAELNGCGGIQTNAAELRSEAEFSLDELVFMKRWDFDDLSIRDDSGLHLPPTL